MWYIPDHAVYLDEVALRIVPALADDGLRVRSDEPSSNVRDEARVVDGQKMASG